MKLPPRSLQPLMSVETWLICYSVGCVMSGLSLFLYGFFPMKTSSQDTASNLNLPTQIGNFSVNSSSLYQKHVSRLVFILIDAFRWDLLYGRMPYTNSLISRNQASLLTARCHPPTATMPKIKALMTGSVPNYIDVALNLGKHQIKEDNLIHQMFQNGMNLLFYGDETWLQLFPEMFLRSEGTTSFMVSDFKEVDDNVTRHIKTELNAYDWDVLFLHYLGLDHIGHSAGPKSPLISSKLLEMDYVIETVHKDLLKWDSDHPEDPSMIVVVGDHGMHDSGSHGGATKGEVLVSLVFIGKGCQTFGNSTREVSQIDVTATLAVLLGVPIPKSSLGVLVPEALGRLSHEQFLYALHYDAHHIYQQFVNLNSEDIIEDCYRKYFEAQEEHVKWLKNERNDFHLNKAKALYTLATKIMSSSLVVGLVEFDTVALVLGCTLLIQVPLLLSFSIEDKIRTSRFADCGLPLYVLIVATILLVLCQLSGSYSVLCLGHGISSFVSASFIFVIAINCWIVLKSTEFSKHGKWGKLHSVSFFFRMGCVFQVVSLCASSFIEEEHQTWYFFWVTALLLLLRSTWKLNIKKSHLLHFRIGCVLVCHRVLRKLNQTGDKWASLPDIDDWLNMPAHRPVLTLVATLSLMGIWLSAVYLHLLLGIKDKILYGMALTCILLYRASCGDVLFPELFKGVRSSLPVHLFWIILCVLLIRAAIQHIYTPIPIKLLKMCICVHIVVVALLMRPHNLLLLPFLIFASDTLQHCFLEVFDNTVAHLWLGTTWYFYQGNSNSLATIDVAAGFVGAEQVNMIVSGILVALHTAQAPILAILLLWHGLHQANPFERELPRFFTTLRTTLQLKYFELSAFCILTALQRHHLFVWSVFAPKLLYEAVLCTIVGVLVLCGHVFVSLSYNKIPVDFGKF